MSVPTGYELNTDQIAEYWRKGFIKISGLLSHKSLHEIDLEANRLGKRHGLFTIQPNSKLRCDINGKPVYDRLEPVMPYSTGFERLSTEPNLTQPISNLLGENSSIFKEKLIYKPPGVEGYEPHQDYRYWDYLEIPADDILTLMIFIDRSDSNSGALEVFPGSHKTKLPAPTDNPLDVDPNYLRTVPSELVCCEPGDAILFHAMLAHRSARNKSTHTRRAWLSSWITGHWGNRYHQAYSDILS